MQILQGIASAPGPPQPVMGRRSNLGRGHDKLPPPMLQPGDMLVPLLSLRSTINDFCSRCNCGWLRLCSCRPTRVMACQGWDDARGPSRLGDAHMTCAGRKLGEQNGQLASELRLLRILLHMQVHFAVSGAQNSRCTAACNGAKGQRGEPAQANYIAISTGLFTPRTRPTTGRQDKEPALHGASRIGFLGLTRPVPPAATVERP